MRFEFKASSCHRILRFIDSAVDKPIAVGIICGAGEVMRAKIKHIRAKIKHIVDDEGDARPLPETTYYAKGMRD
jgi:uridylate kinase